MLPQRLKFILDGKLTVANLLDRAAEARPERLLFSGDEDLSHYGVGNAITSFELRVVVNRLTNTYLEHGVGAFERVGIWKANSLDYFFHAWATMRLGAISVPINGGMPVGSLIRYACHCGVAALITDARGLSSLRASSRFLPDCIRTVFVVGATSVVDARLGEARIIALTEAMEGRSERYLPPHMDHDQDVLICHTSGTTGFPKGVLHCSRSLILAAKGQLQVQFISADNVAMTAAWMNHHIAISGCFTSVAAGMHVHALVDHDPERLLDAIERHRVNVVFAFPDIYQRMCRFGLDAHDLSSVRMWMTGGDAMHEVHIRQLVARGAFLRIGKRRLVGSVFCELLGTSEVGMVALMKISTARTRRYGRCVGRRTPVSPKVKVADETGKALAAGQVGRLMVKGPTVFKGYWNQHDRLHGVVRDGWWWTGDLAVRDGAGRFYQIDRDVDAVHTASGPVFGLLVEEEALRLPDVIEAAVVGRDSPAGGQRAVLILQMKPSAEVDADAALSRIRAASESGARIDEVVIVHSDADIPRGLTGKVLKRVLRERVDQMAAV